MSGANNEQTPSVYCVISESASTACRSAATLAATTDGSFRSQPNPAALHLESAGRHFSRPTRQATIAVFD